MSSSRILVHSVCCTIAIQIHTFPLTSLTVCCLICNGCLVAVCLYKQETFGYINILLLEFSFPLKLFILHATHKEADNVQMERKRKLNEIKAG